MILCDCFKQVKSKFSCFKVSHVCINLNQVYVHLQEQSHNMMRSHDLPPAPGFLQVRISIITGLHEVENYSIDKVSSDQHCSYNQQRKHLIIVRFKLFDSRFQCIIIITFVQAEEKARTTVVEDKNAIFRFALKMLLHDWM